MLPSARELLGRVGVEAGKAPKRWSNIVDPRLIIRAAIVASVAFHLAVLTLALLFSEVRRFGPVAAENVAVDIVTPDQAPEPPPTPKPETSDAFDLASKSTPESSAPDSAQSSASQPSPSQSSTAQPSATEPSATQQAAVPPLAAVQPQSQTSTEQAALAVPSASVMPTPAQTPDRPPPAAQPQATAPTPTPPTYAQPQPDLSVKYHVRLGLPQAVPGDVFRGPATENAEIEASSIGEFRRHLKSCSILPKSVAPSDDVAIKLRILLTRDGRLAAEPLLIEAKASVKGPLLTQAAIGALQSCQPYSMLPVDKYDEWKVLDVTFTPRDFGGS
jgi:hypothetical protein